MKNNRIGLIAGEGELPVEVFKSCKENNIHIEVLKASSCENFKLSKESSFDIDFSDIKGAVNFLKNKQISDLVFAGRVDNQSLFKNLSTYNIDYKNKHKPLGDDSYYTTIINIVEDLGFKVISILDILKSSVTENKLLTDILPSDESKKDIEIGYTTIKAIGALDIGQALIIDKGYVIGIEAIEGTDGLITRCKSLKSPNRSGVLVKVKKTCQDSRIDIPVIGKNTIIKAYESNLSGIALESNNTVIINKKEVINVANKLGIFITGIN